MPKFRKKPVVIEAVQVTAAWFDNDHPNDLHPSGLRMDPIQRCVYIDTMEWTMRANVGDWIITGVAGERYPIKDAIFHETHEAAE